jgi:hypothetical protein
LEAITAVLLKIQVAYDVTLCSFVKVIDVSKNLSTFHLLGQALQAERLVESEQTSVAIYQSTRRNITVNSNLPKYSI